MPSINGLRNRTSDFFDKLAYWSYPPKYQNYTSICDIGADKLPKNARRALIIYAINAIPYYVKGNLKDCPILSAHTMFWESAEMVRLLNKHGFIVDYYDCTKKIENIDWDNYQIIIDERDNLKNTPKKSGQKKIFYSTGCHWLFGNQAELYRVSEFHKRNGLIIETARQNPPYFSDQFADYITYFGNGFQLSTYDTKAKMLPLDISISSFSPPPTVKKVIDKVEKNFLWLGGSGSVHKGMDLAVEAFMQMPEYNLYIAGSAHTEPRFWNWLSDKLTNYKNIHYLGFVEVNSDKFHKIADNCIGIVYPSGAEGGAGSVAQAMHHGLIPIVTKSTCLRADDLGYIVKGQDTKELISDIIEKVTALVNMPASEKNDKSDEVRQYALNYHTREAYSKSFEKLIEEYFKK